MHTGGISKDGTAGPICRAAVRTDGEQTCGHGAGQGGRRGQDAWREWPRNIHSNSRKTESQWEFAVWLREIKPGSVTTWRVGEVGNWEGGSRGRGHMCIYGLSMMMYGRNQHNIIIILQLKIREKKLKHAEEQYSRTLDPWFSSLSTAQLHMRPHGNYLQAQITQQAKRNQNLWGKKLGIGMIFHSPRQMRGFYITTVKTILWSKSGLPS